MRKEKAISDLELKHHFYGCNEHVQIVARDTIERICSCKILYNLKFLIQICIIIGYN